MECTTKPTKGQLPQTRTTHTLLSFGTTAACCTNTRNNAAPCHHTTTSFTPICTMENNPSHLGQVPTTAALKVPTVTAAAVLAATPPPPPAQGQTHHSDLAPFTSTTSHVSIWGIPCQLKGSPSHEQTVHNSHPPTAESGRERQKGEHILGTGNPHKQLHTIPGNEGRITPCLNIPVYSAITTPRTRSSISVATEWQQGNHQPSSSNNRSCGVGKIPTM